MERREQVTYVGMESTGNRRNFLSWRKPAGFHGWHEPDESRDSRPDLWEARGAIPRAYPAESYAQGYELDHAVKLTRRSPEWRRLSRVSECDRLVTTIS